MKRRVDADNLRGIVLARLTKGSAFSMTNEQYVANQATVRDKLASMSPEEIMAKWPECTYDLKLI